MAIASSFSSFSSLFGWTHEVFLSFRGEDTRKTFTDHLHAALVREGIDTFIDDQLHRGEEISAELVRAIERSRIAIIVLFKNYASSRWCLDELVKIMECRQVSGQKVIPVFLQDADPTDVRHQRGSFGEPFGRHEERFGRAKVDGWRKALTQAVDISGCSLKDTNGYEAKVVQFVVKEVLIELSNTQVENRLVGIKTHVQNILPRLLQQDFPKGKAVRYVIIYGGVGIGKTTIARAAWDQISKTNMFEHHCFLEDIQQSLRKPSGIVSFQEQFLSNVLGKKIHKEFHDERDGARMIKNVLHQKKVLLVLDNVDHMSQLNGLALAECLFGTGSTIILTSRHYYDFECWLKKNRILWHGFPYKPNELDFNESLQLFSINAFGSNHPPRDFKKLAEKMVIATGGLPLALEELGSSLYKKTPTEWISTLENLKENPNKDMMSRFKILYNGLDHEQKAIFLDIACFLIGYPLLYVCEISTDYVNALTILLQKSLVEVNEKRELMMYNLVQSMGREIVYNESPDDLGNCSRLWKYEEVMGVLAKHKEATNVRGLSVRFEEATSLHNIHNAEALSVSTKALKRMSKLSLLRIVNAKLVGNFIDLPLNLRWLCWQGCPLENVSLSCFPNFLTVLDLSNSSVKEFENWKPAQAL